MRQIGLERIRVLLLKVFIDPRNKKKSAHWRRNALHRLSFKFICNSVETLYLVIRHAEDVLCFCTVLDDREDIWPHLLIYISLKLKSPNQSSSTNTIPFLNLTLEQYVCIKDQLYGLLTIPLFFMNFLSHSFLVLGFRGTYLFI